MSSRTRRFGAAACALVAVVAAGCSTKSSGGHTDESSGGVKTDVGVTGSTITLGTLSDLSGPFAAAGKAVTQSEQLYFDQLNAAGGVCGRKVKVIAKDHSYNVQTAVTEYQQIKSQVLAIVQLLGSPQTSALFNNISADKMVVIPSANVSSLLSNPEVMLTGASYDYEQVNLIDYAVAHRLVAKGDKVGYIYLDNVGGQNAVRGAQYAAKINGLTIVSEKVQATDVDMTSQVTDLKSKGVKLILFTSSPTAAASAVGVDAGIGLNVPVLATDPAFAAGLLKTAAAPALEKLMFVASSTEPVNSSDAGTKKFVASYHAKYASDPLDASVVYGYGSAKAFTSVLQKACTNKDLTRAGLTTAFHSLSNVQTGALAPLDYSQQGTPPATAIHIFQPSAAVPGGLKEVTNGLYTGPDVKGYQAPAAK